jgi:hypothetical protein
MFTVEVDMYEGINSQGEGVLKKSIVKNLDRFINQAAV